jgi:hypothetical protein
VASGRASAENGSVSLNKENSASLYERDYFAWIRLNAQRLREQRPALVDWENVAEELEDLGRAERRTIQSQLEVLLTHLLKWAFQAQRRSRSWQLSIANARDRLSDVLEDSPSLRDQRLLSELFAKAYRIARRTAAAETGFDDATPPWSLEDVLDEKFFPAAEKPRSNGAAKRSAKDSRRRRP